ncbi:putative von Willebrand factor, type A, von Willebrand factor A-like domain superfamily [Helianthus annuus]|nr:putative von Willebrand factor, type A, von Willebrand factor A-like domain superfamily [Helianthus annuus]
MHDDDFTTGVEDGLRLSKRIYFGNDRSVAAPKPVTPMDKATGSLYPTSPMVYAVIINPMIVDNPDMPSYQPHVHGRCNPPALIPLQMNSISFEVECFLDTAFVSMSGSWRVHCVMGNKKCTCRVAVPMGEEGSILGAEVEVARKSYSTRLALIDENEEEESEAKPEEGGLLKAHIFTFTIPQVKRCLKIKKKKDLKGCLSYNQVECRLSLVTFFFFFFQVDGGSNLSIKVRWSQKIMYKDGEFILDVPYSFPEYVTPASKKIPKKEKIQLNVNCGPIAEVSWSTTSHQLKERKCESGKLDLLYEAQVLKWSNTDFVFKYHVSTTNLYGGVLLQSPPTPSFDQREMFCLYLVAGPDKSRKVFRKEVVFVVDISESMIGNTIEVTKNALIAALSKLDQEDSFGITAFNNETQVYSSTLESATNESIINATEWINTTFIASGGTNMSNALDQALKMFSGSSKSIPMVFFITDGAVEYERHICEDIHIQLQNKGSELCPRINTFGIGSFCNHYFLQTLAMIGKGQYYASYDADSIEVGIQMWFSKASSSILANVVIDGLDDMEVYPSTIPDLCSERPLIISGRFKGNFPEKLKVKGVVADTSDFTIDIEVQLANNIPLEKVPYNLKLELITVFVLWFVKNHYFRPLV